MKRKNIIITLIFILVSLSIGTTIYLADSNTVEGFITAIYPINENQSVIIIDKTPKGSKTQLSQVAIVDIEGNIKWSKQVKGKIYTDNNYYGITADKNIITFRKSNNINNNKKNITDKNAVHNANIVAFDVKDGKELWQSKNYQFVGQNSSPKKVTTLSSDGIIFEFFTENEQDGEQQVHIYALETKSGKRLWDKKISTYGLFDVSLANGLLAFNTDAGKKYYLNQNDGELQYSHRLAGRSFFFDGKFYYKDMEEGSLHSFDTKTFTDKILVKDFEKKVFQKFDYVGSSLEYMGQRQDTLITLLFSTSEYKLAGISKDTGEIKWTLSLGEAQPTYMGLDEKYPENSPFNNEMTRVIPLFAYGKNYHEKGFITLMMIDVDTGKILWQLEEDKNLTFSNVFTYNNMHYVEGNHYLGLGETKRKTEYIALLDGNNGFLFDGLGINSIEPIKEEHILPFQLKEGKLWLFAENNQKSYNMKNIPWAVLDARSFSTVYSNNQSIEIVDMFHTLRVSLGLKEAC